MKNIMRIAFVVFFGLAVLFAGGAQKADATPTLKLMSGADEFTVLDADADGIVSFLGPVGNFFLTATTGFTKPALGAFDKPFMDLLSFEASNLGDSGTLDIWFTEKDFDTSNTSLSGFSSVIGGHTDGTLSFEAFIDPDNRDDFVTDGDEISLGLLGPFSGGPFAGLVTFDGSLPATPYSLSLHASIFHDTSGGLFLNSTSFDAKVVATPEPGTIVLLGIGLAGLVGAGVRKHRKMKSATTKASCNVQ